jgi:hypothetical protein
MQCLHAQRNKNKQKQLKPLSILQKNTPPLKLIKKDAYIKQAPAPSAECCAAAKKFNDARCSCDAAVLGLAAQFLGGSTAAYASVAKGFADACKYPALIGGTC